MAVMDCSIISPYCTPSFPSNRAMEKVPFAFRFILPMPLEVDTHSFPSASAAMPCMQLFGKPFSVLSRRVSFVRKSWHINPFCVPIQTDVPSAYAQLYFVLYLSQGTIQARRCSFFRAISYPKSPFCPPMMSWPGFISMAKLMARLRFSSGKSSLSRRACPFSGRQRYRSFKSIQTKMLPSERGRLKRTVSDGRPGSSVGSARSTLLPCILYSPCRVLHQNAPCGSLLMSVQ